jgi:putative ABC transport system ATP-binding protein
MTEVARPLIQIQELIKMFYADEVEPHALSGIPLSFNEGEYAAMSGRLGCGKSTLLSIGLLDTPTSGSHSLNRKLVQNLDFAERSRIRNQEIVCFR